MSNRPNHRRNELRRTENGPRWESHNPGKGCNSTHVARSRKGWKQIKERITRRLRKRLLKESNENELPFIKKDEY
jgi:hypothetical protein